MRNRLRDRNWSASRSTRGRNEGKGIAAHLLFFPLSLLLFSPAARLLFLRVPLRMRILWLDRLSFWPIARREEIPEIALGAGEGSRDAPGTIGARLSMGSFFACSKLWLSLFRLAPGSCSSTSTSFFCFSLSFASRSWPLLWQTGGLGAHAQSTESEREIQEERACRFTRERRKLSKERKSQGIRSLRRRG